MRTLVLKIEYNGAFFSGWQIQDNARSVQEVIEKAFLKLKQGNIKITGSGRTDSGVHASGQIAHAYIDQDFSIPDHKICLALNNKLPLEVRITGSQILEFKFHSRFDAIAREYIYNLSMIESVFTSHFSAYYRYPIKADALLDIASMFEGKHDFTTYSKYNPAYTHYICEVEYCKWHKIDDNNYQLKIRANRFVYGMVRALTGAMLDYARGKCKREDIEFALQACDRRLASPMAAPEGLILSKIYYPEHCGLQLQ